MCRTIPYVFADTLLCTKSERRTHRYFRRNLFGNRWVFNFWRTFWGCFKTVVSRSRRWRVYNSVHNTAASRKKKQRYKLRPPYRPAVKNETALTTLSSAWLSDYNAIIRREKRSAIVFAIVRLLSRTVKRIYRNRRFRPRFVFVICCNVNAFKELGARSNCRVQSVHVCFIGFWMRRIVVICIMHRKGPPERFF